MPQKLFNWREAWHQYAERVKEYASCGTGRQGPLPEFVHWRELLSDLKATGLRDRDIELACGLRQGYVAQLRGHHVSEPTFEKGSALLRLWLSRCIADDS